MRRWLIIEEFGTNIQHIAWVENLVADTLSRFPSTPVNTYDPITSKAKCFLNELSAIGREEKNEYGFTLNILDVQREQQKEPRIDNSKLSTYISD